MSRLFGGRSDGDFADLKSFNEFVGVPTAKWSWLSQVHGSHVVTVTKPGQHQGDRADAAVTTEPGCVLVVRTADCAPVALIGDGPDATARVVGLAHAGWRGAESGVLQATVAAMRELGAIDVSAELGPCIGPGCYEFGATDLARMVDRYGAQVASTTQTGKPSLDLPLAATAALAEVGVSLAPRQAGSGESASCIETCTACHPANWFSHRARSEPGRQASFVWLAA